MMRHHGFQCREIALALTVAPQPYMSDNRVLPYLTCRKRRTTSCITMVLGRACHLSTGVFPAMLGEIP